MKAYLVIVLQLLIVTAATINAQAVFTGPEVIRDLDTTEVSINVLSISDDDLSSSSQGLCAISVDMRHDFLGDIVVNLISPAGQVVQLMGPAVSQGANTQLARWDVSFNACAFPAFPDGTFEPVWNNLNPWSGFSLYTGTYYPNQGCLEDFDQGTVTGEWTLQFIDQSQFGEGRVNDFQLFFCNSDGLVASQCDPGLHNVTIGSTSYCQFGPEIEEDLTISFEGAIPDNANYGYGFIAFINDTVSGFYDITELRSLSEGNYTICGLSYLQLDSLELQEISAGMTEEEVNFYLVTNDICASFSENCSELNILEAPELVIVEETICEGESIEIDGVFYSEQGSYNIITSAASCDSISQLNLFITVNDFEIESSIEEFSCTDLVANLQIQSLIYSNFSVSWSTADGFIIGNDSGASIDIGRPGLYIASVLIDGCMFEEEFFIGSTGDYIFAILTADTLTCLNSTIDIVLETEGEIDSLRWTSDSEFIEITDGLQVNQAGVYAVELFGTQGCNTLRGIEVIADTLSPVYQVASESLTCTKDTARITIYDVDTTMVSFSYNFQGQPVGSGYALDVSEAGEYSIIAVGTNGCSDTSVVSILDLSRELSITIMNDTITCDRQEVALSYGSADDDLNESVLWTYPDLTQSDSPDILTSLGGVYSFMLESDEGCKFDTNFVVELDTVAPNISISPAEFNCAEDSIQLQLAGAGDSDHISWLGPLFSSVEEDPFITDQGTYFVTVISGNGCESRDSVIVDAENSVPEMNFSFGEIDCENDSIFITPSRISNFEFRWTLPDGSTDSSSILIARDTGIYQVRYTDVLNSCFGQTTLKVEENFLDSLEGLSIPNLDCLSSTVTPVIQDTSIIRDANWFVLPADTLFSESLFPQIAVEGDYVFSYTLENGCMGVDTIMVKRVEVLPQVMADGATISCNIPSVDLISTTTGPPSTVTWIYPNGEMEESANITTDRPGIYTIVATAVGRCSDTTIVEVVGDTLAPSLTLITDGTINCQSDNVAISIETNDLLESVAWSGDGILQSDNLTAVVNQAGFITVELIGLNGCSAIDSIMVEDEVTIPSYMIAAPIISCADPVVPITIVPNGNDYEIEWMDDVLLGFSPMTSTSGDYIFEIFDGNDCGLIDTVSVLIDTATISSEVDVSNALNCSFDFVTLKVGNEVGSAQYKWIFENDTISQTVSVDVASGGMYYLETISANGCKKIKEIEVIEDFSIPNIDLNADTITCALGKAFIDLQSDLEIVNYSWSGPQGYVNDSGNPLVFTEGVYYVTVTATNGCQQNDSIEIVDIQIFPNVVVDNFFLRCDSDPVIVTPSSLSEGSTVSWFGPNNLVSEGLELLATVEGEYVAFAVNIDGCISTDTFQVIDEPVAPMYSFEIDSLICSYTADLVSLETEDDIAVEWYGPDGLYLSGFEATTNVPGEYQIVVTGTNGCEDTSDFIVQDNRYYPLFQMVQLSELQCDKETTELKAINVGEMRSYSFLWYSDEGNITSDHTRDSITIMLEGTYNLEIIDDVSGCVTVDSLNVIQDPPSFTDLIFEVDPPSCEGFADAVIRLTDIVGAFPPYTVMLDQNNYGNTDSIQYLGTGNYVLSVTDSIGCNIKRTVDIDEGDYPFVELPPDTIISLGESILIDPLIFPDSTNLIITWNIPPPCGNCTTFTLTPEDTYYLEVTVENEDGCSSTDNITIRVSEKDLLELPSIFSPNGDNTNDFFYLPYTKGILEISYMKIHDWNGLPVFSTINMPLGEENAGWNGSFKGKEALEGVYIYEILLQLTDGSSRKILGDITLVR